jgi:ribose transport system substrate-binding protein
MSAFKTRTLVAVAAFATALTMTACGSSSSGSSDSASGSAGAGAAASDYTIGVSVADQKSLFYIAAVDGMNKAAADAGVKLVVLSADNNSNQQVNQVNDLITQQVDALIFIAQDATAAAAGVKAANKANIPVIAVDEKPESGDGELATYIATDSVKAADALCTWVFA